MLSREMNRWEKELILCYFHGHRGSRTVSSDLVSLHMDVSKISKGIAKLQGDGCPMQLPRVTKSRRQRVLTVFWVQKTGLKRMQRMPTPFANPWNWMTTRRQVHRPGRNQQISAPQCRPKKRAAGKVSQADCHSDGPRLYHFVIFTCPLCG